MDFNNGLIIPGLAFIWFLLTIVFKLVDKVFNQKIESSRSESKKDFEILRLEIKNISKDYKKIQEDIESAKKELKLAFDEFHKDKEHLLKNIKNSSKLMHDFADKLLDDGVYKDNPSYLHDIKNLLKNSKF
jgi:hypothetical protein